MNNYYKRLIFTSHALGKLPERGLTQEIVYKTYINPDKKEKGKEKNTYEFQKKFGTSTITIITKQNEKNERVVISAWIDPPLPGSQDFVKKEEWKKYKNAKGWRKIIYLIKKQLGL